MFQTSLRSLDLHVVERDTIRIEPLDRTTHE
jgi:hypothetical protein